MKRLTATKKSMYHLLKPVWHDKLPAIAYCDFHYYGREAGRYAIFEGLAIRAVLRLVGNTVMVEMEDQTEEVTRTLTYSIEEAAALGLAEE